MLGLKILEMAEEMNSMIDISNRSLLTQHF